MRSNPTKKHKILLLQSFSRIKLICRQESGFARSLFTWYLSSWNRERKAHFHQLFSRNTLETQIFHSQIPDIRIRIRFWRIKTQHSIMNTFIHSQTIYSAFTIFFYGTALCPHYISFSGFINYWRLRILI